MNGPGSSYARPEFLVETDWLEDHLDDPKVRIFDCTTHLVPNPDGTLRAESALADYRAGHIPGAGYLDLQAELSDPAGVFRFTTPSAEDFAAAVGARGIGDETRVVLYSTGAVSWAARVWWMLYAFGFENAAILNGGWANWQAEARSVSTKDDCTYPPAGFTARARPGLIVDSEAVLAALDDDGAVVVNALTREQHEGTSERHYGRPGGISDSVCLPALDLLNEGDGRFLDADSLRAKFAECGIDMETKVLTYCGGGVAATVDTFALALLGHDDAGIYDNSLSEWANNHDLPMRAGG
jgi:thiosulfate/3-mercaptopyruvate sulfurtransferase